MSGSDFHQDIGHRLQIYPNPVSDVINIDLGGNSPQITRVQLLGLSGQVLKQIQVAGLTKLRIPRDHLNPGLYLLKLYGDEILNFKVVVQ